MNAGVVSPNASGSSSVCKDDKLRREQAAQKENKCDSFYTLAMLQWQ
jgi:hypothetical protein